MRVRLMLKPAMKEGAAATRDLLAELKLRPAVLDFPVEFRKDTDEGLVFGGGVAFKFGPVRISPELRYTRWGSENFRDPIGSLLRTNKNQGDFLLGILF